VAELAAFEATSLVDDGTEMLGQGSQASEPGAPGAGVVFQPCEMAARAGSVCCCASTEGGRASESHSVQRAFDWCAH
jgi:hypothetical protein